MAAFLLSVFRKIRKHKTKKFWVSTVPPLCNHSKQATTVFILHHPSSTMPMPSASLTTADKVVIRILSGLLLAISTVWHGHSRIRSIGISNFPLGFALFCKYARPFASHDARAKSREERKNYDQDQAGGDPLDDPVFARMCGVWSVSQLLCAVRCGAVRRVVSVFDW